jgi:ATP-dependent Zn protease
VLANEDARQSVDRLLDQAKADVHMLLNDNRHLVIALRDELLEREELVGDEIIDVLHEAEKRHKIGLVAEA